MQDRQDLHVHASLIDLSQAVMALSAAKDVDDVLQRIVNQARTLVGSKYAALGIPDETGRRIAHFFTAGMPDEQIAMIDHYPEGLGLLGVVLTEAKVLRLANIADHPASVGFPEHHPPMTSFLGVPITRGDEVLGDLYLTDKIDGPEFTAADEALATLMAQHAAIALHDARLLAQLSESERRYRALTEGAPAIVFACDTVGRLTYVNRRARDTLGVDPDDLAGRTLLDLAEPADRPTLELHLRSMRAGAPRTVFAMGVRDRDGGYRQLEVSLVHEDPEAGRLQGIAQDVTERHALAREMAERGQQLRTTQMQGERLREFVSLIIQAQEEERARIAGDLHDTTVQTLTAIGRRLRGLAEEAPDDLGRSLTVLGDAALDEAEEVRRLSRNLRPSVLDHLGLPAALENLAGELRNQGLEVDLDLDGDADRLDDRARTTLFRVAQEALTNVRRHSGADSVTVALSREADAVVLTVQDTGKGFEVTSESDAGPGLGLLGMRERVAIVGGELHVSSRPGAGTTVRVRLPA